MAHPPLSRDCKHYVFPSFHGEDVRRGLLGCLLKEFKDKGIDVFIDNKMDRNKPIASELITAIRGSMIAIVLISKNYASSTWCLNELVEITKCRQEHKQITMVVFNEVEPSDVKKQTGYFGTVFKETCIKKTPEEINRWKQALEEVAQISGYKSEDTESDILLAERIATDISNKLNDSIASNDCEGLVGMENHIKEVEDLLSLDSDEVRMVGIWGSAGIGKTTIARALYKNLKSQFTHHAFIESNKGKFRQNYQDEHVFMLYLQEQLLSKTLRQKDMKIDTLDAVEARLKHKKVLVVLDDVHDLTQLEAMTSNTSWFGPKSRIIITTKDKQLLKAHEINHVYNVGYPSQSEALEILCQSAFRKKLPPSEFKDMAEEVTCLAGNLPLGLRVFGAYLRGMSEEQWTHALPRLRTSLDGKIEKVLRFSYDALCYKDQELFLYIVCFFKGGYTSELVECLESRLNVNHGLKVLCDRSFVSILECGLLLVHNLLEQLGKDIVRRQCESDPGKRQFLVDAQEISNVLSSNTGTETIRGIDFEFSEMRGEIVVHKNAFEGMSGLQFMRLKTPWFRANNKAKLLLPKDLKFRGNKLKFLEWDEYPMKMLPRHFNPQFLVHLKMTDNKLEKLWKEAIPLPCLKMIILNGSHNLKKLPNLSKATNLEVLLASDCTSLVEIPSTIGEVTSLQELNLCGCYNLIQIPSSIGNAININTLNFFECRSLVELPSSIWSLKRLENLEIKECSKLKHLGLPLITSSSDISAKITELNMSLTNIEEIPSSIIALSCLRKLETMSCKSLKVFPNVPESIEVLFLENTGIKEVPSSIQNLSRLTTLSMCRSKKLKIFPTNINLVSLKYLDLSDCTQLKMFPEISTSIVELNMSNTAIEEVPSSILSWSSLLELNLCGCSDLSQEAKEFILKCKRALSPGKELPGYFDHQAKGDLLTINLEDHRPLQLFLRFKVCLLLLNGWFIDEEDDTKEYEVCDPTNNKSLSCCIWGVDDNGVDIGYGSCKYYLPDLLEREEHLYFIESSISIETDVDLSALVFQFKITGHKWRIEEIGVTLMYNDDDDGSIYKEKDIIIKELSMQTGRVRARNNFQRKPWVINKRVRKKPTRQVSVGKKKRFQRIWSSTLGRCWCS